MFFNEKRLEDGKVIKEFNVLFHIKSEDFLSELLYERLFIFDWKTKNDGGVP